MESIMSEGLSYIGRIDDQGYIFNDSNDCIARIDESGYILRQTGSGILGKIDEDGTIRDASLDAVGRVQADGYVYIHSKRVCKVSSKFVESITPRAWNAGSTSSYSGRANKKAGNAYDSSYTESSAASFFSSGFFIKLVIGIVLGIIAMATGTGGIGMILAGPIVVFLFCFFAKLFR